MSPSNRLSQGSFEDFDFILADNFARAARFAGLKQIIYVGGIVDESKSNLSQHLRSRLEVEQTLAAYGTPVDHATQFSCDWGSWLLVYYSQKTCTPSSPNVCSLLGAF